MVDSTTTSLPQAAPSASIEMRGKRITTAIAYGAVRAMRDLAEGDLIEIVADDFEAIENDLHAWCRMAGHRLVEAQTEGEACRYLIAKGHAPEVSSRLAMVISDAGLLELLSPLGFALGAALAGTEVHVYVQGPAVRMLTKGFEARLRGLSRPFSRFARRGLASAGHYPPQEKLRQLQELGGQLYLCGGSMDHFKVTREQLAFDDVIVAEYITFIEVMRSSDMQIVLQ